jgi:hypothetical protein
MTSHEKSEFEKLTPEAQRSLTADLIAFLMQSKKWWLLPILIIMLMITALVLLVSTGAGPFIYTLF